MTRADRRIKSKVTSTDRARLLAKLEDLRADLGSAGGEAITLTLRRAIDRWLAEGLDGRSPATVRRNRAVLYSAGSPGELRPEFAAIGGTRLRELTAAEVREALSAAAATRSTATVALMRNCLTRAIRHAQAGDLVHRNVAGLIDTPAGQAPGRPSRSLTMEQAAAVIAAAQAPPDVRLHPGLRDVRRPPAFMQACRPPFSSRSDDGTSVGSSACGRSRSCGAGACSFPVRDGPVPCARIRSRRHPFGHPHGPVPCSCPWVPAQLTA